MHHNAKQYTIKRPCGEIVEVTGMSDFAKSEGLNLYGISRMANGHLKSYKGYTLHSRPKAKLELPELTKEDELYRLAMGIKAN